MAEGEEKGKRELEYGRRVEFIEEMVEKGGQES